MARYMGWALPVAAAAWMATSSAAAPGPAGAGADSALAAVPATAPIVIHVRGVERTKDRIATLMKNAVPDFGPFAAMQLNQMIDGGFKGRKLKGLPKDGSVVFVMTALPKEDAGTPEAAVIARVNSYTEFRDGMLTDDDKKNIKNEKGIDRVEIEGQEVFFLDKKDYAVMAPTKAIAEMFNQKFDSLAGKLDAGLAAKLMENDVGLYVNMAAVMKEYGDKIAEGKDSMMGLMEAGQQSKAQAEAAKKMVDGIHQAMKDGNALVVGVDFRPEGLNLHMQGQVGSETTSNKMLADQKPTELEGIEKLTAGQMIYTAIRSSGALSKAMASMAAAGDDKNAKFEQAVKDLIASGTSTSFSGASLPPVGLTVATFEDPAKAIAATQQMLAASAESGLMQGQPIKGAPEIKKDAETHRGIKFDHIRVVWDLEKLADSMNLPGGNGEDAAKAMSLMMGKEMNTWTGSDGKQVFTLAANNWTDAKAKLDQFLDGKSPLKGDAAFTATRKQLPAKTTMMLLIDSGPFTVAMGEYMLALFKAMPGLPFNLPENMVKVKTSPAFIGTSVTLQPERAAVDIFLPVSAVKEIRNVITPLLSGGAQ